MRIRTWLLLAAFFSAGCAFTHLHGEKMRGVDLEARHRVHVVRHSNDERNIDRIIVERLAKARFEATSGPESEQTPDGVQAIVTYEDHWTWDLRMYLLTMRIDFRDPVTRELLATGQSYRTSAAAKSPEFTVDEIIGAILAKS